eukprot:910526_1
MLKSIATTLVLLGGVQSQMTPLQNCVPIVAGYNFHWTLNNDNLTVMTETNLPTDTYVAWAIPGDNARNGGGNRMLPNGDAQVSVVGPNGPTVLDAVMRALSVCDANGNGVCPDTRADVNNGMNSNMNIVGTIMNGVTYVMYDRPLIAADLLDQNITLADNSLFLFASGRVTAAGAQIHSVRAGMTLSLANGPGNGCEPLMGATTTTGEIPTRTLPPVNTAPPTNPPRSVSGVMAPAAAGVAMVLACVNAILF